MDSSDFLQLYQGLALTPIPLKLCSKEPVVRWGKGWNPTASELWRWAANPDINWSVRYDPSLSANREKMCGVALAVAKVAAYTVHSGVAKQRHEVGI